MNEQQVEHSLIRLKDSIAINRDLQKKLRTEFIALQKRYRKRRLSRWMAVTAAMTAAVIALAIFLNPFAGTAVVSAASLQVSGQGSFVDIGAVRPLGAEEYDGTVYIPVFDKGLYAYDSQGMHRISDRRLDEIRVNPDGTKLAWASEGTIGLYDIRSQTWTVLCEGGGAGNVYYENPSWESKRKLLFVRKEIASGNAHGFETKFSEIFELDLDSGKQRKLADGSFPSYSKKSDSLVYQKDSDSGSRIVIRPLDSGEERILDNGRFPSVSPNGSYVAYVKTDQNQRELKPGASVETNVDNVWIANIDGSSMRAVTSNTPWVQQDEKQWANSVHADPNVPYVLMESGLYSYYNPSWSSDSQSLFVMKGKNAEGSSMSLTRIDLAKNILPAEETVKAFERAAISHDDDFARSLLNHPADYTPNSDRIGFRIAGSGTVSGREYVEAEETWADTAGGPQSTVTPVRYYVDKTERGYRIDSIEKLNGGTAVRQENDDSVVLETDSGNRVLFKPDDIPSNVAPAGKWKLASLAYEPHTNSLLFTVQSLGEDAGVSLIRYDISSHAFQLVDRMDHAGSLKNLVAGNLILSSDGLYAALELSSNNEPPNRSHVLVYDLKKKSGLVPDEQLAETPVESTRIFYMDGRTLHLTMNSEGMNMQFAWDAADKKFVRP